MAKQFEKGTTVRIAKDAGCMTHSGAPVGFVPAEVKGREGIILSGPEQGDYIVDAGTGAYWVFEGHLEEVGTK